MPPWRVHAPTSRCGPRSSPRGRWHGRSRSKASRASPWRTYTLERRGSPTARPWSSCCRSGESTRCTRWAPPPGLHPHTQPLELRKLSWESGRGGAQHRLRTCACGSAHYGRGLAVVHQAPAAAVPWTHNLPPGPPPSRLPLLACPLPPLPAGRRRTSPARPAHQWQLPSGVDLWHRQLLGPFLGASLDTCLAAATGQQLYVALHTTQYPAGALRGQLAPAAAWVAEATPSNNIPPLTDKQVHGARARFAMTNAGPTKQGTKYQWTLAVENVAGMSMAHFHSGGPTENGPHVVMLVPFGLPGPNGPLPLLSPTFSGSQTFSGDFTTGDLSGVSGEAFDTALQTDPTSAFYVSVHTQEWSAGALRGQVLPAFVWEAELAAANNVPPLTDQQVAGAKAYFSMIDLGTSYSYELTVEGVQDFTNAHFHWGAANENGPIILNLVPVGQNLSSGTLPTLNPAFSGTATYRGNFTTDDLDGVSPADFKAALRTGPSSQLYIAVHTTEWPGGAIRGQLHWSASPGSDVLSVYNGLSGSAGGGGATSGAARGSGGSGASGLLALTLALAAALALLL